jgi:hypothetical protein
MGRFIDFLVHWGETVYRNSEESLIARYSLNNYMIEDKKADKLKKS